MSDEAVQNARPNNTAPTCLVALKIKMYNALIERGEDGNTEKSASEKITLEMEDVIDQRYTQ